MTVRVEPEPELLEWACTRAGLDPDAAAERFPDLPAWLAGTTHPTLKQLEAFANATHTPLGYLFLPHPPVESIPIPDLRTVGNAHLDHPSVDLLDTLYQCQQRQDWYRNHARALGSNPLPFVGSATLGADIESTAATIRDALGFDLEERRRLKTWTDALRRFIEQADALGVLVMLNGIVGTNTHRPLDPDEFRGFALADAYAPLVFINGADTKAAQMFTLAHELAHVWLGKSALSDASPAARPSDVVEVWCNKVAAELLAPLDIVKSDYRRDDDLPTNLGRLATRFKVSTLVVLRRLHDAGFLSRPALRDAYDDELERIRSIDRGSGGNFYTTHTVRVGKRFARSLIVSTLEGRTLYKEAFRLLGFAKVETFNKLAAHLEIA